MRLLTAPEQFNSGRGDIYADTGGSYITLGNIRHPYVRIVVAFNEV
jgi:hypothetical protein